MALTELRFVRAFRTASSERFLALQGENDVAAIDLHFLTNGQVAGTVVVLSDAIADSDMADLLRCIDDDLLPGASMESGSVSFAVVRGKFIGNYVPQPEEP